MQPTNRKLAVDLSVRRTNTKEETRAMNVNALIQKLAQIKSSHKDGGNLEVLVADWGESYRSPEALKDDEVNVESIALDRSGNPVMVDVVILKKS